MSNPSVGMELRGLPGAHQQQMSGGPTAAAPREVPVTERQVKNLAERVSEVEARQSLLDNIRHRLETAVDRLGGPEPPVPVSTSDGSVPEATCDPSMGALVERLEMVGGVLNIRLRELDVVIGQVEHQVMRLDGLV